MCHNIDCFFFLLFLAWLMVVSTELFLESTLMSLSRVTFVRMVNCNVENKYNLV